MILAYVAGPYRDHRGAHFINENIQKARVVAAELWQKGYAVICPHMNTAHMDGLVSDSEFLRGTLEMMKRCDLVVLVSDNHRSFGTHQEIYDARRLQIPVFKWEECPPACEFTFND